jgi:hypothetical protein
MNGLENLWPLTIVANIWEALVTAPQWIPAGLECSYNHIVSDSQALGEVAKSIIGSIIK